MPADDVRVKSSIQSSRIGELYTKLAQLCEQIDKTRAIILGLRDNWDGEGAKGYQAETWDRATEFVKNLSYQTWKCTQKILPPPEILPGPHGSIDVHWKTPNIDLLLNVPEDETEPATFSADDYKENSSKGTFDLKQMNQVLLFWVTEIL